MGFLGHDFNFFMEILPGQKFLQIQSLQPGWVGAAAQASCCWRGYCMTRNFNCVHTDGVCTISDSFGKFYVSAYLWKVASEQLYGSAQVHVLLGCLRGSATQLLHSWLVYVLWVPFWRMCRGVCVVCLHGSIRVKHFCVAQKLFVLFVGERSSGRNRGDLSGIHMCSHILVE